jgi:hypothetical protein
LNVALHKAVPQTWATIPPGTGAGQSGFANGAIYALAYDGKKTVVGVNHNGTISYSTNLGATWTRSPQTVFTSGAGYQIRHVVYGAGVFVAGLQQQQTGSTLAWSADGAAWTAIDATAAGTDFGTSGTNNATSSVVYDGAPGRKLFVAGGNGKIAWSADGKAWNRANVSAAGFTTALATSYVNGFAYGGGRWLAYDAANPARIAYSDDDCKTWTAATTAGVTLQISGHKSMAYGGPTGLKKFVIGTNSGNLAWSSDGITWHQAATTGAGITGTFYRMAYGGGKFVAAHGSGVAWSYDGETWYPPVSSPFTNLVYDVAYANGVWAACGIFTSHTLLWSYDGKTWKEPRPAVGGSGYPIIFVEDRWIAGTTHGYIQWSIPD